MCKPLGTARQGRTTGDRLSYAAFIDFNEVFNRARRTLIPHNFHSYDIVGPRLEILSL